MHGNVFFNYEEGHYLRDFSLNRGDKHKFNYKFIPNYIKESENNLSIPEGLLDTSYKTHSIIDIVNHDINNKLFEIDSYFLIAYKVVSYILKTEMRFDIDALMKDGYFINVIQKSFLNLTKEFSSPFYKNSPDKALKRKANYSLNLMGELIYILYICDHSKPHSQTNKHTGYFKKEVKYVVYYMIQSFLNSYENDAADCIESLSSEDFMKEIKEETLNDYFTEKRIEGDLEGLYDIEVIEAREIKVPEAAETIDNPIKEQNFPYDSMPKAFEGFITGGDAARYKSIIEDYCLPTGSQPLKMRKDNKADIARFLYCFDIPFENAESIFGVKIEKKDHSKKSYTAGIYYKLKQISVKYEEKANAFLTKK